MYFPELRRLLRDTDVCVFFMILVFVVSISCYDLLYGTFIYLVTGHEKNVPIQSVNALLNKGIAYYYCESK